MDDVHFFVPEWEAIAGEYYFTVDCPETGRPLPFELDQSKGRRPYPQPSLLFVSCPMCQGNHEIEEPVVESLQVVKTARQYQRSGHHLIPL